MKGKNNISAKDKQLQHKERQRNSKLNRLSTISLLLMASTFESDDPILLSSANAVKLEAKAEAKSK